MQGAGNGAACSCCRPAGSSVDGTQGVYIQYAVRGEHAGDDAVRPGFHQRCGRLLHLGQLVAVVAEITKAGTQQCPHRQSGLGFDLPQQGKAGGGAADHQVGTQFQSVGSAALGGQCTGRAVHADF